MSKTYYTQGIYTPKNPQKYKGTFPLCYRSYPELQLMRFFDYKDFIVEWGSESVVIPYIKPTDGKIHRYFVDFIAKFKEKDGHLTTYLIEYKPFKQTFPPIKTPRKKDRTFLLEQLNWSINTSKWESARQYCQQKQWKFIILTEKDLD